MSNFRAMPVGAVWCTVGALVCALGTGGLAPGAGGSGPEGPVYVRPAKAGNDGPGTIGVRPVSDELREEYEFDPFYEKAAVIDGIPIIGSERVSDYAFLECAWIVDHMLAGRAKIKKALLEGRVRIGIMAVTEYTMDIPENQRPRMLARAAYHDRRSRGLGGRQLTTCAEENLLSLRGDPYRPECITIHEFSHTIASNLRRVDRDWWGRLRKLYRKAMDEELWADSYAATSAQEYWAEGTQSWFDCNTPVDDGRIHNGIWNREKLKEYDPRLAEFLEETYGDGPWRYSKTTDRREAELGHLAGLDRESMPAFDFENSPRIRAEASPDAAEGQPEASGSQQGEDAATAPDAQVVRWIAICALHGWTAEETARATELPVETARELLGEIEDPAARLDQGEGDLHVLPYPGGRHPRLGFRDGAIDPRRGPKASVFLPKGREGFLVVDLPEAVWARLDGEDQLVWLAHTHIPTVWDRRRIRLARVDWKRKEDGALASRRLLPDGLAIEARVVPHAERVDLELRLENGTPRRLEGLRAQVCVLLGQAAAFAAREGEHEDEDTLLLERAACARSRDGGSWVVTAWERGRPWAEPRCPCIHSDPVFDDLDPGESTRARGVIFFWKGEDVRAEVERRAAAGTLIPGG